MTPYLAPVDEAPVCGLCRRARPPFVKAVAYGSYEGALRDLIHLLKYERVHPAAKALGGLLTSAIHRLHLGASILVIPVPLHAKKQRQRGCNQSELILRMALKNLKKMEASADFQLRADLLVRSRETRSQIGLSSHQRRENMRGAFVVRKSEAIRGREILLVDDVFTTGTTVSECCRVLRRAGASKVYVATVARTLKFEAQAASLEPEQVPLRMAAAG